MACPPMCGPSQRHIQIEAQFQEDLTTRDRVALGAMTVAAVGGASLFSRVASFFLGGSASTTVAGAGTAGGLTAKVINTLQRTGPDLEARTNAVLNLVPRNLDVIMRDTRVGGQVVRTIRGGTGDRLREYILREDGSSTVRAFDAALRSWKTLADIAAPK